MYFTDISLNVFRLGYDLLHYFSKVDNIYL
jgi:hypothetical protein